MEQSTQSQPQTAKKRGCAFYGGMGCLVMVGLFMFFGILGSIALHSGKDKAQEKKAEYDAQQASKQDQQASNSEVTETNEEAPRFVFDLETLYGKNIHEIRIILGEPSDGELTNPKPEQVFGQNMEWDNTFKKDGYELLVTYNYDTGEIIDFFIPTNDPSGQTKDTEPLKEVGNVVDSSSYIVEAVQTLRDQSYYTGIKITPVAK